MKFCEFFDGTGALPFSPFRLGEAEILLVPNRLGLSDPGVLLLARYGNHTISDQLSPSDLRRLAEYLNVIADEADVLSEGG